MHRTSAFTLFLALAPSLCLAAYEQCWYPDGQTQAPDVPCNSDGSPSACCNEDAFCLANGLCMKAGLISRGSCTDKSWNSGACAQYCTSVNTAGGWPLQPCDGQKDIWACGVDNSDCINNDNTFPISNANAIVLRASQVKNIQTGALTLGPTSVLQVTTNNNNNNGGSSASDTNTNTPTPSSSARFTAGQMAGVGAGIGIPLLLALLAALFVIFRQRKHLNRNAPHKSPSTQELHPQSQAHGPQQGSYAPSPAWSQPPQQMPYQPSVATKYEDPANSMPYYRPSAVSGAPQQSHFREGVDGVQQGIPLNEMSGEGRAQELATSPK